MKTVAPLLMASMASLCKEVLGGRTPLARRWTMVRGRERSWWRWGERVSCRFEWNGIEEAGEG